MDVKWSVLKSAQHENSRSSVSIPRGMNKVTGLGNGAVIVNCLEDLDNAWCYHMKQFPNKIILLNETI